MQPTQCLPDLNNSTLQQSIAVPFLSNIALPNFLDMCLHLQSILSHTHNVLSGNQSVANPMIDASRSRSKTLSYKRSYSPESLERAVRDVRSGRLGTRRASLVYGIPRSTLRNKVYRMDCNEGLVKPKSSSLNKYLNETGTRTEVMQAITTTPKVFDDISKPVNVRLKSADSDYDTEAATTTSEDKLWTTFLRDEKAVMSSDFMTLFEELAGPSNTITTLLQGSSMTKAEDSSCWKKSRPKRGHYRKYDKAALDKAVNSVRQGEMSVHRAGSVYGVPHSTLEYKVKERNLLKKKKFGDTATR